MIKPKTDENKISHFLRCFEVKPIEFLPMRAAIKQKTKSKMITSKKKTKNAKILSAEEEAAQII